ncbi:MAG TPA: hypothetical protein ENN80_07575, partial [Candidatus Hydrogenedentes bacterium]|nr:hypothetical protein [Candidatus Hydrogenedentota bacterium]
MRIRMHNREWGAIQMLVLGLLGVVAILGVLLYFYFVLPFWGFPAMLAEQKAARPPITPPWALECWLWEDDHNNADYVLELLEGYEEHDFPVRAILIDSPWTTRYNDFVVDEERYPDPAAFFGDLE